MTLEITIFIVHLKTKIWVDILKQKTVTLFSTTLSFKFSLEYGLIALKQIA